MSRLLRRSNRRPRLAAAPTASLTGAPYATLGQLAVVAATYGVTMPSDDEAQRALILASHDLDAYLLGVGTFDAPALVALTSTQGEALVDATCIQAAFRLAQGGDMMLAVDDGISAAGSISFSIRPPARLSPEASDRVAGVGLLKRSGCAPPPPVPPGCPTGPCPPWP